MRLVVITPGEYDEAELGVGAWLNGESVYRVEGVAVCAYRGAGGVASLVTPRAP